MRIGLNLLYLIPGFIRGTATYGISLINALVAIDPENEYFVFLNEEAAEIELANAPNLHRVVCPFRAVRRPVRYAWEQLVLPWQLHAYHINVIHSLGYVGPLCSPCPSVVTIHDLNYVALRDSMSTVKRLALRFFSGQSTRVSEHVITVSDFSKREIVRVLNLPPDKVTVIHSGPGLVKEVDSPDASKAAKKYYNLPSSYVVAFGRPNPHKNISRLIAAFSRISDQFPRHHLVLIGQLLPYMDANTQSLAEGLGTRIITLGNMPDHHIAPVLSQADLFVLPSLYEGFGLTILEAQQSRVAVACSSVASLPEVAGDGAIFFDPFSIDNMAKAIRQCLSDADLRSNLRRLGKENVRRFSWEKTGRETLAVYKNVYCTKKTP